MKSIETIGIVVFILIWLIGVTTFIVQQANYAKSIEPHLEVHAAEVSSLFYQICVASKLEDETISRKALESGLQAGQITELPLDSFGMEDMTASWNSKAKPNLETGSTYQPYPNQLWLFRIKSKTEEGRYITKRRCQLDFHHGVMNSKDRPYYIERRGFHDEYRELLGVSIVNRLEQDGAEIIDAVTLYKDPRIARDPIIFDLEGVSYHLRVRPFSLSLELE